VARRGTPHGGHRTRSWRVECDKSDRTKDIAVTSLQHLFMRYENRHGHIDGKVGTEATSPKIKAKVLDAITSVYRGSTAGCKRVCKG
jgi:hypothetical protein